MNSESLPEVAAVEPANLPGWKRSLRRGENLLVVLALAAMTLLPVLEIILRRFFKSGIPASVPIVQHLVLAVGMLGGALAARDNRLLSLSVATHYFKGGVLTFARVFSNGFAAAVSAALGLASWNFVVNVSRSLGKPLAFGLPIWVVQLLLVIGFALIAIRLVWHSSEKWRWRLATLALALALLAFAQWTTMDVDKLRWPALAALLVAIVCGAPVFTALGGAAAILFWTGAEPLTVIPSKHYQLTVNPTLPSIPLFTLAGYFLAEGGAARRLVRVFQTLFGTLRGGPAIVTALVCAFFTSFTGASGVTILALGGLLMPVLISSRYSERASLGLLTGAGSLGLLFPPCLPPILYSIIASSGGQTSVTMEEMFQGGLLPGLLLVGMTAWWGIRQGPRLPAEERPKFSAREAWLAVRGAIWELLIPVVALGALFSGLASPPEAAAVTALYAFMVEVFVYRDLKLIRDVPRVMGECGLLIGGVLLILGVALGFTHFLIDAQIPDKGVEWVTGAIKQPWQFLLVLNLFLLIVGCLMDIYSAIVVVVPLIVPVANAFGINPVHLGIIFLANLELGFLTPPVGMNLFLASYRFNKPMSEITRASLPMLAVLLVGVLLITYVPWLTTWLPGLFK